MRTTALLLLGVFTTYGDQLAAQEIIAQNKQMDKLGFECVLRYLGQPNLTNFSMLEFFQKHFNTPQPSNGDHRCVELSFRD